MSEAGVDLLKAAKAAILANAYLSSRLQSRVFSSWDNQEGRYPIIRLSIPNTRQFEMDGGEDGDEIDFNVHIFTNEASPLICRQMAREVRKALKTALALDGANLVSLDYRDTVGPRGDAQDPLLQTAVVRFLVLATPK